MSSSGVSTSALISKLMFRDLLGNVVKEVDEARDPQSEALISSRTRRKQYNSVGQLTAEIDATEPQGRVRVQHPWRQARHAQRTRHRVLRPL